MENHFLPSFFIMLASSEIRISNLYLWIKKYLPSSQLSIFFFEGRFDWFNRCNFGFNGRKLGLGCVVTLLSCMVFILIFCNLCVVFVERLCICRNFKVYVWDFTSHHFKLWLQLEVSGLPFFHLGANGGWRGDLGDLGGDSAWGFSPGSAGRWMELCPTVLWSIRWVSRSNSNVSESDSCRAVQSAGSTVSERYIILPDGDFLGVAVSRECDVFENTILTMWTTFSKSGTFMLVEMIIVPIIPTGTCMDLLICARHWCNRNERNLSLCPNFSKIL